MTIHQPREQAVPCVPCGARIGRYGIVPNTMTWNTNCLCDLHQPLTRVDEAIWRAATVKPAWQGYYQEKASK